MELELCPAIDSSGRTIWIAHAHRDDGKRFVVHADEKLTAFLELESAFAHTPGDLRKQITSPKFKIIFVEMSHLQTRTGSRLNHVNIVAIDNSVRFDVVPKILSCYRLA